MEYMKRRLAWFIFLIVFVAAVLLVFVPWAKERARRSSCGSNLRGVWCTLQIYSMDHDGSYPGRLELLGKNTYITQPKIFVCKSAGTIAGSMTDVDDWMDYTYIYWPQGKNTPSNFPVMYDRLLSNHHGNGIQVIQNCGGWFWDTKGEWLKGFAKDHPELKIPLPKDLK